MSPAERKWVIAALSVHHPLKSYIQKRSYLVISRPLCISTGNCAANMTQDDYVIFAAQLPVALQSGKGKKALYFLNQLLHFTGSALLLFLFQLLGLLEFPLCVQELCVVLVISLQRLQFSSTTKAEIRVTCCVWDGHTGVTCLGTKARPRLTVCISVVTFRSSSCTWLQASLV